MSSQGGSKVMHHDALERGQARLFECVLECRVARYCQHRPCCPRVPDISLFIDVRDDPPPIFVTHVTRPACLFTMAWGATSGICSPYASNPIDQYGRKPNSSYRSK